MPDFALEQAALRRLGGGPVAGVDEAGRGPWAGPVVAAAVILDPALLPADLAGGLDDSKVLKPARREAMFAALDELAARGGARIGIGRAEVAEIDRLNILEATLLAMLRAVEGLGSLPALALVDGNRAPRLACPVETVVRGDGRSLSIAAASVVAKVTRDRLMGELARAHPGYGWERNMGYGTAEHAAALRRLGATPHHRRSFKPVHNILSPDGIADSTCCAAESS